ncbi:hypothetical protein [Coxiella-like endosymbiont]
MNSAMRNILRLKDPIEYYLPEVRTDSSK